MSGEVSVLTWEAIIVFGDCVGYERVHIFPINHKMSFKRCLVFFVEKKNTEKAYVKCDNYELKSGTVHTAIHLQFFWFIWS